jgi:DNA-binding transcriptional regulator YiaG
MKRPEYRSEVAAAVHEGVRGMHRLGLVDKKTMREFDVRCLTRSKNCRRRIFGRCADASA